MIRKITTAGVGAIMVLTFAACGGPHQGVVHDKQHSDGYYYSTNICASYNSQGACTVSVPQTSYQPPSWSLDIYNGDDHGWVDVTEGRYDSVNIGDSVNLDK